MTRKVILTLASRLRRSTKQKKVTRAFISQRRNPDIPLPLAVETFHWHIRPKSDRFMGTVYSDGSLLDAEHPDTARAGWAFVVFSDSGRMSAAASGVPPPWIRTSSSAEIWAFYMAIVHAMPGCCYRIDSKTCVQRFQRGEHFYTAGCGTEAQLWKAIFKATRNEIDTMDVSWIPAHTTPSQIGRVRLGDGRLLSPLEMWGNAMADKMAKQAVEEHRVPEHIRKQLWEHRHFARCITTPVKPRLHHSGRAIKCCDCMGKSRKRFVYMQLQTCE